MPKSAEKFGLQGFPYELLLEIFSALPWRDVFHIHLTCRHFYEVVNSKSFLRDTTSRGVALQKLRMDRPLEAYDITELHDIYWRRCKAEAGYERLLRHWRNGPSPGDILPRHRTMASNISWMHLVPGGRWLLLSAVEKPASILYCDLELADLVPQTLIEGRDDELVDVSALSIDLDHTSSLLRFNILYASYPATLKYSPSRLRTDKFQLWTVTTTPDPASASQTKYNLQGKLVRSFLQEPPGYIISTSILGDDVAYSFVHDGKYASVIANWRKIRRPHYPKRMCNESPIRLLSSEYFMAKISAGGGFDIFQRSHLPVFTQITEDWLFQAINRFVGPLGGSGLLGGFGDGGGNPPVPLPGQQTLGSNLDGHLSNLIFEKTEDGTTLARGVVNVAGKKLRGFIAHVPPQQYEGDSEAKDEQDDDAQTTQMGGLLALSDLELANAKRFDLEHMRLNWLPLSGQFASISDDYALVYSLSGDMTLGRCAWPASVGSGGTPYSTSSFSFPTPSTDGAFHYGSEPPLPPLPGVPFSTILAASPHDQSPFQHTVSLPLDEETEVKMRNALLERHTGKGPAAAGLRHRNPDASAEASFVNIRHWMLSMPDTRIGVCGAFLDMPSGRVVVDLIEPRMRSVALFDLTELGDG